jgi:Asp-tRNA(Asn)/Glu-tRNA(Gln) amidotransferase A subunit family amidase
MSELTDLTIAEAGRRLNERSVSSFELVEACLARIEETEPTLHAYARVLADSARNEARTADRELASGRWRGPLHGIPVAVKDLCFTRGVGTEAGSRAMAGFVPDFDATIVERLREAGAPILGKTVTHEFAYGQNIPPTRNPWDLAMYPGGSSAGSGVATAVGSTFAAIGTDTGGSIRVPASINGIVGLKPTYGLVSRYGVVPLSGSLDHAGPMARTVEDCAIFLQAVAGFDPQDSGSADRPVPDFRQGLESGIAGARVGLDRGYFLSAGVTPAVASAFEAALEVLGALGAEVVELRIPELELSTVVGLTILQAEASTYHKDVLRTRLGDFEVGTRLMLEFGQLIPSTQYVKALGARKVIADAVRRSFEVHRLDALVGPTLPIPTVLREQSVGDFLGGGGERVDLSGLLKHGICGNVTGVPTLTQPCGFDERRLPIGLQLFGRPFREADLFRLARAYEAATSWHTTRPRVDQMQTA